MKVDNHNTKYTTISSEELERLGITSRKLTKEDFTNGKKWYLKTLKHELITFNSFKEYESFINNL